MMKNPEFILITGPMMSGKTTQLLSRLERYDLQRKTTVLFKPVVDDRYDVNSVVTHSGFKRVAVRVHDGVELLSYLQDLEKMPDVIAVDEAFMLKSVSSTLIWLYRNGFTVLVSSLELSFKCHPLTEITHIMPWATTIEKLTAVCAVCGADAYYTYRKNTSESEIVVGGHDMYEARCHMCHPIIKSEP